MEKGYLIVIAVLILIILVLAAYLFFYKKQLRLLIKQLQLIEGEDTNIGLSSTFEAKEFTEIILIVNKIIRKHRNIEIKLKKVNRSFKESITSISHDIRTPLTSVRGYIQLLGKEESISKKQQEYIKVIENRFEAVSKMLNQLFEYARIEAGELVLEKEPVAVQNVLCEVLSSFYHQFTERKEEPTISLPEEMICIEGDYNAFSRVIENILNNALRHGIEEYAISLQKEGNMCKIRVANRTDSIEEYDLDRIFERFYTTDKSRNKKGTGLGLAIAKKLVEQMEGEISASLEEQIFTIELRFQCV